MSETGIYIRVGNDNVLLEDLDEIERTIWLESLSENGLIRTVNRCCDVIEDFIVNYQQLQQENQQLKEKYLGAVADYETTKSENQQLKEDYNEAVTDGTEWESRYYNLQDKWDATTLKLDHENKILKSALDEIREYIIKYTETDEVTKFRYLDLSGNDIDYLLQILDKVKE